VIQQVGILSESEHESFHALSSSLGAETRPVTGFDDPRAYDIIALPASEARRPLIRHIQTPVLFVPLSRVPAR
jgi:hypothetical protein